MPLVLTQYSRDATDLNRYLDREGVIYHFPKRYLPFFKRSIDDLGDRRFLYQRPIRNAPQGQAGAYFGYGLVGDPFPQPGDDSHFFVPILDYRAMRSPVPLRDGYGNYYETAKPDRVNFQGRSVRLIDIEPYQRILAIEGAYSVLDARDPHETGIYAPVGAPKDAFRPLDVVPPGTGYVPREGLVLDRQEIAALQERARDDHQRTVDLFVQAVKRCGGRCDYNNNVDVLAQVGERRMLVEVKSLTRQSEAVDRMRYGMGQLMDYSVRYRAELLDAEPVLAFGTPPGRELAWIPDILEGNNIAFVANDREHLVAKNARALALPIF